MYEHCKFTLLQESEESKRYGRQLMAAADGEEANGTLYKDNYVLLFLQSVNLTVYPRNQENSIISTKQVYMVYDEQVQTSTSVENETIR